MQASALLPPQNSIKYQSSLQLMNLIIWNVNTQLFRLSSCYCLSHHGDAEVRLHRMNDRAIDISWFSTLRDKTIFLQRFRFIVSQMERVTSSSQTFRCRSCGSTCLIWTEKVSSFVSAILCYAWHPYLKN